MTSSSLTAAPVRDLSDVHGRHVGRQHVVGGVHGDAVTREEEEHHITRREALHRLVKSCEHRPAADVFSGHDVEADLPERAAHRAGVVHRFLQLFVRREVDVTVIADDKRHTLLRAGRHESAPHRERCDGNDLRKSPFQCLPTPSPLTQVHGIFQMYRSWNRCVAEAPIPGTQEMSASRSLRVSRTLIPS